MSTARALALDYLRMATAFPAAEFRDGQWEAIEALVVGSRRALVIQRTGWGKSLVYFLATRLLRDQGKGPTLLISPLLALMRDQELAAQRVGLTVARIDSTNREEWEVVENEIREGRVDIILISPERLANEGFMQNVLSVVAPNLALLVIDEAHCISDWGHDFRPDYRRIGRIIRGLPRSFPVLATTATANQRVVDDVKDQLGDEVVVQRGELTRASLRLRNIRIRDSAERLAWLARVIPRLPGSGIIYTLTVRDARYLSDWLRKNRIEAAPYYGDLGNEVRLATEDALRNNELKVVVATSALGMGFDKPDLHFVIHYQTPQSLIHYYQQVGRAGRAVPLAYGILLNGDEDGDIISYFIRNAFPAQSLIARIIEELEEEALSIGGLEARLNVRRSALTQALKTLETEEPPPIVKDGSFYLRTASEFLFDQDRVDKVTALRWAEWAEIKEYLRSGECLMKVMARVLGDGLASDCGTCSSCSPMEAFLAEPPPTGALLREAQRFLKRLELTIEPRKRWTADSLPFYGFRGNIKTKNEEGRTLARWGDPGWGQLVRAGKDRGEFEYELVSGAVELIKDWSPEPPPSWVTCVPSLANPTLVPIFAQAVAKGLGIPFRPALIKVRPTQPQKDMANSFFQANNLDGSLIVDEDFLLDGPVLLVDDVVDSRWSLTIAGFLLRQAGVPNVFPLALADAGVV